MRRASKLFVQPAFFAGICCCFATLLLVEAALPLSQRCQQSLDRAQDQAYPRAPRSGNYSTRYAALGKQKEFLQTGNDILQPSDKLLRAGYKGRLWPDGRIPFTFDANLTDIDKAVILCAHDEFKKETCINFVPKTDSDKDYVQYYGKDGCSSYVGKIGGWQPVNLAPGCMAIFSAVLHEMMHAVGFQHEQSRNDRDNYIQVNLTNAHKGGWRAFDKTDSNYDFLSLSHYNSYDFAISRDRPVMTRKNDRKNELNLGFSKYFTNMDIDRMNKMYNCKAPEQPTPARAAPYR